MSANDLRDVTAWRLAHRLSLRIDLFLLSPDFRNHYRSTASLSEAMQSSTRHIAEAFTRTDQGECAACVRAAKAAQQRVLGHVIDAYDQRLITHDELVLVQQLTKRSVNAARRLIQSLESAAPRRHVRKGKTSRRANQPTSWITPGNPERVQK